MKLGLIFAGMVFSFEPLLKAFLRAMIAVHAAFFLS